ncbi:lysosomal Pro-X carboxypeptidase-like isoform X2 [Chenopodium quinoa]|uniref:lysosomal Pro-X carboxypeptidase-like isoform X2 n=1 Tax=Chenopodium quinoa TaxID=63459 RepID=UPI000B799AEA|nr:lysosomal Pro-X carboxypeptidase-like isoform X2 [Chenopodium quinoa]
MISLKKLFKFSIWFLFFFFSTIVSTPARPWLGGVRRKIRHKQDMYSTFSTTKTTIHKDLKVLYYPQTLDHFNYQQESYVTFKQKYMMYSKHWGGAKDNYPIFVHFGDEEPMFNDEINWLILPDYAAKFKALVVIIEHRYYGWSKPFGMSMEEIIKNTTVRGYFNSAQALADSAEIILFLKKRLNATYSPVIVFEGSYGGMLASWFRLKYPHIALGALAASAPVLYFDNMIEQNHGYYYVVTNDFKEASENCYNTIKSSWAEIDKIGSTPKGLSYLSNKFKTCSQLQETRTLKDFLENMYDDVAQYSDTDNNPSIICKAIDQGKKGNDILSRIYAGVHAYFNGTHHNCFNTNYFDDYSVETNLGYDWQTCSEMVMPVVRGTSKLSMFPPQKFSIQEFIQKWKKKYNVVPRPHWITTNYGGHDMKLVLERFGSNIIFSNGLKDPYSSAGISLLGHIFCKER